MGTGRIGEKYGMTLEFGRVLHLCRLIKYRRRIKGVVQKFVFTFVRKECQQDDENNDEVYHPCYSICGVFD